MLLSAWRVLLTCDVGAGPHFAAGFTQKSDERWLRSAVNAMLIPAPIATAEHGVSREPAPIMNLTRSSVMPAPVPTSHSAVHRTSVPRKRSGSSSDIQALPAGPRAPAEAPVSGARAQESSAAEDIGNPFASLEQETTRTFQVSDELLELAREHEASSGATRAYEVPAELMEMARRKKLARTAASLKPSAAAAPSGEAESGSSSGGIEATQTGPRLAFSELSEEDRAWVESALVTDPPRTEVLEASQVRAVQLPRARRRKSHARWLIISVLLIATSALALRYTRLLTERQSSTSKPWYGGSYSTGLLEGP